MSDEEFVLLAQNPADVDYNLGLSAWTDSPWKALGIRNNGAANHSNACATHIFSTRTYDGMPRFHPKDSNSYNGKYGNKVYALMDDSSGNKNIFKMLEGTDKSGDPGKKLRGTSKFYSGTKEWQKFEFEFVEGCGVHRVGVGCEAGFDGYTNRIRRLFQPVSTVIPTIV